MSDQSRAFPGRPNLRFLKLEAKRRLAAGEFGTLHDAQLAIAREHDLASWTALKEFVRAENSGPGPALSQVRWVLSRFAGAGEPGWAAPGDDELRAHFDGHFLSLVSPGSRSGRGGGVVLPCRRPPRPDPAARLVCAGPDRAGANRAELR